MNKSVGLAVVLVAAANLVGCAAEPARDAASSNDDDVVGATESLAIEKAVGLEPGDGGDDDKLHAGACYQALVEWGSTLAYGFRRYGNGAAYFVKEGTDHSVVCVDRFEGKLKAHSLSGVVLDAVLRYDLGRLQKMDDVDIDGTKYPRWTFERGNVVQQTLPGDEPAESVRRAPFESFVSKAASISGRLVEINVDGVSVLRKGTTKTSAARIDGLAAFVAYRYAHRKGEDRGVATTDDTVGRFSKKAKLSTDPHTMENLLELQKGQLGHVYDLSGGGGMRKETITFRASASSQTPLAECTRVVDLPNERFPEFKCTGI